MLVEASRSTPMGFWRFFRDYLCATKAVEAASDDSVSFPTLYLYGLTIELALKAFLLKRDFTPLRLPNQALQGTRDEAARP